MSSLDFSGCSLFALVNISSPFLGLVDCVTLKRIVRESVLAAKEIHEANKQHKEKSSSDQNNAFSFVTPFV